MSFKQKLETNFTLEELNYVKECLLKMETPGYFNNVIVPPLTPPFTKEELETIENHRGDFLPLSLRTYLLNISTTWRFPVSNNDYYQVIFSKNANFTEYSTYMKSYRPLARRNTRKATTWWNGKPLAEGHQNGSIMLNGYNKGIIKLESSNKILWRSFREMVLDCTKTHFIFKTIEDVNSDNDEDSKDIEDF